MNAVLAPLWLMRAGFGCAAARILEKAIVNGTRGYEAVVQTVADLQDPNRINPISVDEFLAAGLEKVVPFSTAGWPLTRHRS